MKKSMMITGIAMALSMASCITAFAGWELTGTTWKYEQTGSYLANTWAWLDGNNDGIAECYCFDENGNLYVNTTTPDQYIVNENGAWIVNGIVQTRVVSGGSGTTSNGMIPGTNLPATGNPEVDNYLKEQFEEQNRQAENGVTSGQYSDSDFDQGKGLNWGASSQEQDHQQDNGMIPGTNLPSTGDPQVDAALAESHRQKQERVSGGGEELVGADQGSASDQGAGLNWN